MISYVSGKYKESNNMPRKCCVPGCRGNYATGPKVSVFFFPRDGDAKKKWEIAIHKEGFISTNQSVGALHIYQRKQLLTGSILNFVGNVLKTQRYLLQLITA